MKSQIRHLVADALYPTKAYSLPTVCERYGLEPGDTSEAFSSKTQYVMRRLERLSDEKVVDVARSVIRDFPDDKLQRALEELEEDGHLVSDITRHNLAEALNAFSLGGKRSLMEMLRKFWPSIDHTGSQSVFGGNLADDIERHSVLNDDWDNAELLERVGFLTCSQARLFQFLEDVVHPIRRDQAEQEKLIAASNPVLQRDGYSLTPAGRVSGYPLYRVQETPVLNVQPADEIISRVLNSYDEVGVHHAWRKALDRRSSDPEGAITAAKTLLETVCDDTGQSYGENDDLPKLYATASECLNLAPAQHSEKVFKSILGNCQSVVNNLAALRNKLGDSHGQGKKHVRPQARHAELAVNLAGSMAMFLVSTWKARKG